MVIQVCLGSVYAWSRFVMPLRESHGICDSRSQILFGTLIGIFAFTMIVAGRWIDAVGLRRMAVGAGGCFAAGYWLAGTDTGGFLPLLVGLGGLAGLGTGLGYMAALTTAVRWFPDRKGLATGFAVGAFGFGAVQMNILADHFLGQGLDVLVFFRGIGVVYGALIVGTGLVLPIPSCMQPASTAGNAGESPTPRPAASSAWRREPAIWGLGFGIFGGTAAGLLVIGNLLPMARAFRVGPSAQAVAITLFAFGNAAGRIVWGWLTDRLDWRAVEASLASLLVGMTLLIATETLPDLFIPAVLLVGFGFGACFVVYAGIVARHHGPWGVGTIYPWLFALYGVAGVVAPTIGASIYESTGSFRPSLLLSIGTLIAAILANVLVHLVANRHAASQVIAEPPPASA